MRQIKCYAIENHPCDGRMTMDPLGIVQTLRARIGTGGGNTPMVLITSSKADLRNGNHAKLQRSEHPAEAAETEAKGLLFYVIDSHPTDSRIRMVDDTFPTITAHIAKVGADGPLVMLKNTEASVEIIV